MAFDTKRLPVPAPQGALQGYGPRRSTGARGCSWTTTCRGRLRVHRRSKPRSSDGRLIGCPRRTSSWWGRVWRGCAPPRTWLRGNGWLVLEARDRVEAGVDASLRRRPLVRARGELVAAAIRGAGARVLAGLTMLRWWGAPAPGRLLDVGGGCSLRFLGACSTSSPAGRRPAVARGMVDPTIHLERAGARARRAGASDLVSRSGCQRPLA